MVNTANKHLVVLLSAWRNWWWVGLNTGFEWNIIKYLKGEGTERQNSDTMVDWSDCNQVCWRRFSDGLPALSSHLSGFLTRQWGNHLTVSQFTNLAAALGNWCCRCCSPTLTKSAFFLVHFCNNSWFQMCDFLYDFDFWSVHVFCQANIYITSTNIGS